MPADFHYEDALLIVDVQNDFCPGGALPVPEGDQVIPLLNRWIEAAQAAGIPVYASRDWHPAGHVSFQEQGGPWPVHCQQGSKGAQFHPGLKLPSDAVIISKGRSPDKEAYSAFQGTDLRERLKKAGVHRLWVGGLALDYCVKESILDALRAQFEVHLIRPATRAVEVQPGDGARALHEIAAAGAVLEEEAAP